MMIGMGLGMVDRDIEVGKEYKVGTFTLNGVTYDRYVKIVDCGALPNNTTKTVAHGITFNSIIGISGWAEASSGVYIPLLYIGLATNNTIYVSVFADSTNITLRDNYNFSVYNSYVILEYYK